MSFRQLNVADPVHAEPVSRRDFLRLRVSRGRRILELSCERLFMRYHDACSEAARLQVSNHEDLRGVADSPQGFSMPPASALFAELERRIADVDELRLLEPDWLGDGAFAREVGARVAAFCESGGLVTTERGAGTEARAV